AHAADTEAIEGPAQRLGDGFADAGLADPGWPHQQYDGAGNLAPEGADGEELDDAALDVVEPRMVLVEHLARMRQVQLLLAIDAPGHRRGPVQVIARDGIFGRAGFQHRELGQL